MEILWEEEEEEGEGEEEDEEGEDKDEEKWQKDEIMKEMNHGKKGKDSKTV